MPLNERIKYDNASKVAHLFVKLRRELGIRKQQQQQKNCLGETKQILELSKRLGTMESNQPCFTEERTKVQSWSDHLEPYEELLESYHRALQTPTPDLFSFIWNQTQLKQGILHDFQNTQQIRSHKSEAEGEFLEGESSDDVKQDIW